MTYAELCTKALLEIGVIAAGETPAASETTHAQGTLNDIVDAWNSSPDAVGERAVVSVSGTSSPATLATRPLLILSASCTASGVTVPVEVHHSPESWAAATMERGITAIFNRHVFCDYQYPESHLHIAPLSSAGSLQVIAFHPIFTAVTDFDDDVELAPGYRLALMLELAVALAASYGRPVPTELAARLAGAKGALGTLSQARRAAAASAAE